MDAFPKATTRKAVDQISKSVQNMMPIESKLDNYVELIRKIFTPYDGKYNDWTGKLWSGVAFLVMDERGIRYSDGDTAEEYIPKIKKNYMDMMNGTEEEKKIALNILNAIKVFPKVVKASKELLPKIKQAETEAREHKNKLVFRESTSKRRDIRYDFLYDLRKDLELIIDYSENKKNQMIIDVIMKPDRMLAFSAIEKGTKNPVTGEENPNPLNRDVIMEIQKFLGGRGNSKCKKSKKKKYLTRKSPAYSASKCAKGTKKKGKDSKIYIVKANKNGVKRWVKFTQKKKSKSKKIKI